MQAPNGYVLVTAEDVRSAYGNYQAKRGLRIQETKEVYIKEAMKPRWLPWLKQRTYEEAVAYLNEYCGWHHEWWMCEERGVYWFNILKELNNSLGSQPHMYASTEAASLVNEWKDKS